MSGIVIFCCLVFIFPSVGISVFNIIVLMDGFSKERTKYRENFFIAPDIFTLLFGFGFSCLLIGFASFKDYFEPLIEGSDYAGLFTHSPIFLEKMPILTIITLVCVASFFIAKYCKKVLPPLITVFTFVFIYIGMIISVAWIVQLSKNFFNFSVIMLMLYPLNYIILCITLIRDTIKQTIEENENLKEHKNKVIIFLYMITIKISQIPLIAFALLTPFMGIILIILKLFGHEPTYFSDVFTQTSDWTFSQQISPPPIEYSGHYLCTVAAGGHKNIVKPLRYGKRHGHIIVVNRQLQIANAFEELLAEYAPRAHRFIRAIYDKYGYPISKHITGKLRADFVYIIMKPLELLFLFVLYMFSINPEERVNRQYRVD